MFDIWGISFGTFMEMECVMYGKHNLQKDGAGTLDCVIGVETYTGKTFLDGRGFLLWRTPWQ